jgi:adenylate cyclase
MSADPGVRGDQEWLLTDGRALATGQATFGALCDRLVGGGLPLFRCWSGSLTLHPLVYAAGCTWRRGGELTVNTRPHGFEHSPMWRQSPAISLLEGGPPVRRRAGLEPVDYPIVADLFALGTTEYLAFALSFGGRPMVTTSFTTDAPGGFTDAQVAHLLALRPALGAVLEIHSRQEVATTVLQTYLGADAGRRVLSGAIRRGDGETIRACLWFSDLRNFTGLSDHLPTEGLLSLLNDAFELQVDAIERVGGTVLKFMGDGLLAIFPASHEDDGRAACAAALAAAAEVAARLPDLDRRRGDTSVRYGLALHFGDVVFGNIGSRSRLDFTVIGPAVNRAARLEALTSRLGHAVLLSGDVAARCGAPVTSLGHHALKGVSEPAEVFCLTGDGGVRAE